MARKLTPAKKLARRKVATPSERPSAAIVDSKAMAKLLAKRLKHDPILAMLKSSDPEIKAAADRLAVAIAIHAAKLDGAQMVRGWPGPFDDVVIGVNRFGQQASAAARAFNRVFNADFGQVEQQVLAVLGNPTPIPVVDQGDLAAEQSRVHHRGDRNVTFPQISFTPNVHLAQRPLPPIQPMLIEASALDTQDRLARIIQAVGYNQRYPIRAFPAVGDIYGERYDYEEETPDPSPTSTD
jgi:hypothetical protein